jgi:beta-mannosidase
MHHLLKSAVDSYQNMVRVWGGGFYEDEMFYDICDELGILVWQDFIFSCSTYPLDEEPFLENVRQEVIQNVKRLRHRTSLALWCGNNEMEEGIEAWANFRVPDYEALVNGYDRFFHHLLPEWVQNWTPITPTGLLRRRPAHHSRMSTGRNRVMRITGWCGTGGCHSRLTALFSHAL